MLTESRGHPGGAVPAAGAEAHGQGSVRRQGGCCGTPSVTAGAISTCYDLAHRLSCRAGHLGARGRCRRSCTSTRHGAGRLLRRLRAGGRGSVPPVGVPGRVWTARAFARLTDDDLDHVVIAPDARQLLRRLGLHHRHAAGDHRARAGTGEVLVELERADITRLAAAGWTPARTVPRQGGRRHDRHLRGAATGRTGSTRTGSYPVARPRLSRPADAPGEPSFDPGAPVSTPRRSPRSGSSCWPWTAGAPRAGTRPSTTPPTGDWRRVRPGRPCRGAARSWPRPGRGWTWTGWGSSATPAGGFAAVRAMLDVPRRLQGRGRRGGNHDNRLLQPGVGETYDGPYDAETDARAVQRGASPTGLEGKLLLVHGESGRQRLPVT